MAKKVQKKTNKKVPAKAPEPRVKDFLDLIAPTAVKFNTDHYVCGGTYRCTLALRSYPASTEELALLRRLGEKSGVTVHIYNRRTSAAEEDKIIHNAENKNKLDRGSTSSMKQAVTAEANLQDVAALIASMRKNSEPLIHCAVFIELSARDPDSLRALRDEVTSELIRSKLGADRLLLRQREGFLSSNPAGRNAFGSQFERVLPAKSVANLYPFNYSGKTDPNGFYIGRDRYGSNIIVDLDRRADDKTTANVLILGNSGQGKSYEELLLVPDEACVTHYLGDLGIHIFKYDAAQEQIQNAYEKALSVMEMDDAEFQAEKQFVYRGEIISAMRDRLLVGELKPGETVLFVGTEPYGGPGDFELRGGVVEAVNPSERTCSVRGEFFTMHDVPLHYVLGRYDTSVEGEHYGFPHVRPLFGENRDLAGQYLREAEASWNVQQAETQIDAPQMM